MLNNKKFYHINKDKYPPFKNGLYLEEFFLSYYTRNNLQTKRKYIPALWTNFQIENWFKTSKNEMQQELDKWISENPSPNGYFTVVQYDDGVLLQLPKNTIVFGACSGDIPIPLIYEDKTNTLISVPKKTFKDKKILCSFVGNITSNSITPNVRKIMFKHLQSNNSFKLINSGGWTPKVNENLQKIFLDTTIDSKFALAPRGYGRSSFRFFECFLLGTIPVYLWNDINWLPFQETIDYSRLCVVLHIDEINKLEELLKSITEDKYNNMWSYYNEIKHLFELEGMTQKIISMV